MLSAWWPHSQLNRPTNRLQYLIQLVHRHVARSTSETDLITLSSAMFTEEINVQTTLQQRLERPFNNQAVIDIGSSGYPAKLRHAPRVLHLAHVFASIYQRFHTARFVHGPACSVSSVYDVLSEGFCLQFSAHILQSSYKWPSILHQVSLQL